MFEVTVTDGFGTSRSAMLKGFIAGNLLKQEKRKKKVFNYTFIIQGFYKYPQQAHYLLSAVLSLAAWELIKTSHIK